MSFTRIIILAGLTFLLGSLSACHFKMFIPAREQELYRIKKDGKTGYINQWGKVVIPPVFDTCRRNEICACSDYFSKNEYGIIKKGDHYGAINAKGKVIIEPQYDFLETSFNNHFKARLGTKWSLIDANNKPVFPFIFDSEYFISDNPVSTGISGVNSYLLYPQTRGLKKTVFEKISPFFEGLAEATLKGKTGYIDSSGTIRIPLMFEEAWGFEDGLAAVKLNGKWGLIDTSGKFVIPPQFDYTYGMDRSYGSGLAIVRQRYKHGLIDRTGKTILPPVYDKLYFESDNILNACFEESPETKCGLIFLKKDTSLIPLPGHDHFDYYEGYIKSDVNGHSGVCKYRSGKVVVPFVFSYLDYFPSGLSAFRYLDKKRNKIVKGYLNKRGRIIWVEDGTNKKDIYPKGRKKYRKHH